MAISNNEIHIQRRRFRPPKRNAPIRLAELHRMRSIAIRTIAFVHVDVKGDPAQGCGCCALKTAPYINHTTAQIVVATPSASVSLAVNFPSPDPLPTNFRHRFLIPIMLPILTFRTCR